jgi:hypothetical protein
VISLGSWDPRESPAEWSRSSYGTPASFGATDKLEVLENINVDAFRAAVRALEAGFLDSGQYFLLKVAENVKKEIRKIEAVR